jgi:peptidoglycan hydrolase-like protein with peptidoglycan-binding domain
MTTITTPPTTAAATTTEPTTEPTTTEPTTTEAPTTEATTTVAPPPAEETTTTEVPAPPSNVVPVAPAATPLVAVGRRSGEATKAIQDRLLELGFWHSGSDGKYGLTTKQAVMAFQKYAGIAATGDVNEETAALLTAATERAHGTTDTGTLVEIDKGLQLLFLVTDGQTQWVLNVSTGNGKEYEEEDQNTPGELVRGVSLTPDGLWKVYRERPEGWWEGDLGQIYRPKYFRGGVAVHGSNNVPNYPASHGCVRVTTQAMDWIWENNLMPMGTTVWVHPGAAATA